MRCNKKSERRRKIHICHMFITFVGPIEFSLINKWQAIPFIDEFSPNENSKYIINIIIFLFYHQNLFYIVSLNPMRNMFIHLKLTDNNIFILSIHVVDVIFRI